MKIRQRRIEIFLTNAIPPSMVAEFVSYDDKGNKKIAHHNKDWIEWAANKNDIWFYDWLIDARLPDGRIVSAAK